MSDVLDGDFTPALYFPVGISKANDDSRRQNYNAGGNLAPKPCAAPPTNAGKVSNTSYSLETKSAAHLGISYIGTGDADMEKKMKVFVREYAKYDTCESTDGQATLRYGAVWRATVLIDQSDASGKINFAMVAASATLKSVSVQVSITHEGFTTDDQEAIDEASTAAMEATASGLNVTSFVKFSEQVEKAIRAAMRAKIVNPLRYLGYELHRSDDLLESVARTFALSYIARGATCTEAINSFPTKADKVASVIRETYQILTKTPCDASDKAAQMAAEQLLGGIKVKLPWW